MTYEPCTEPTRYTIQFDSNNILTVRDKNGNIVEGQDVKLPISLGEKSELVESITHEVLEFRASHYLLKKTNGAWKKYILPH